MKNTLGALAIGVAWLVVPACFGAGEVPRVEVPAGFPEDVPLPAAARLVSSQDLGRRGLNLVFETARPLGPALADARADLEEAGWRFMAEVQVEDGVFLSYRKEERTVALGVTSAGDVTTVSLVHVLPFVEGDK